MEYLMPLSIVRCNPNVGSRTNADSSAQAPMRNLLRLLIVVACARAEGRDGAP